MDTQQIFSDWRLYVILAVALLAVAGIIGLAIFAYRKDKKKRESQIRIRKAKSKDMEDRYG